MAVIIETSMVPNLVPLMLHFATVLGPAWTVVLFTVEESWTAPPSTSFQRAVGDGHVEVRFLPPGTVLKDVDTVSSFLTKPWLWEQVQSAPRVLFFQSDSIICSKSSLAVEDFIQYDFIGAPIDPKYGEGFNGGLSLRNPSLFLQITREVDFASSGVAFEDQWYYQELRARAERSDSEIALPSPDVAKMFAVETLYSEQPLGYHQPRRWQSERMPQIEEWCPEVNMLIGRRLQ
jgi:hypothetical protein